MLKLLFALCLCALPTWAYAYNESYYEAETTVLSKKVFNLRATPFDWILLTEPTHGSSAHATLDIALTRFLTIGPRYTLYRSKNSNHDDRIQGLGLEGVISLGGSRFENGWLFIPYVGIHFHRYQARDTFRTESPLLSAEATTPHFGTWFGYQWNWGSGFNIRLAAGLDYDALSSEMTLHGAAGERAIAFTQGGLLGSSEFTIGMIF